MGTVHLTFDNGPHPAVTPHVLDVLATRGVTATFFVLGKHLDEPWGMDLARRIRDAGHRLANHSWSHEIPLGQDPRPDAVHLELARTRALLDQVWDGPRWFRPFGGGGVLGPHLLSPDVVAWLQAHGATCVLWNSVPGDWLDADGWVDKALADVRSRDHTVVVLHDILPEAMAHLDGFIAALQDEGHTFSDAFPEDCLPLVDGQPRPGLGRFVQQPVPPAG